ncbi:MAG: hypothetical protein ACI85O_001041 [Saprospiraceae bacterium]|jgi:hypothetical protein
MQNQLGQLDDKLNKLFTDLESYSTKQLCKKPAPNSWSAIQILHHLILSEKYSRMYCEKKLSFKPKLKKAGLSSTLRTKFVNFYLMSPFKAPAPKQISSPNLPTEDTLDNIHEIWLAERVNLAKFIQDLPQEYADKEIYKHPLGGRLSVKNMMDFFDAHFRAHEKQIYRALK